MTASLSKYLFAFSGLCAMLLLLCGCHDDEPQSGVDLQSDIPVTFFSEVAGEDVVSTRASSEPLSCDFQLYGYKLADAEHSQLVFDDYLLKYVDGSSGTSIENSHGYSYVGVAENQTIKFWDYSQVSYRFWGYVPVAGKTTYDKTSHTLTFGGSGNSVDADALATYFCTRTNTVESVAFGNVVVMEFVHPAVQVEVRFYSAEQLDASDCIELTDIRFRPEADGQLVTMGSLCVKYDPQLRAESYLPSPADGGALAALSYEALTLRKDHCTSATSAVASPAGTSAEAISLFPHATDAVAVPFTMSVSIDGDEKSAVVPAAYMHWLPHHRYTYIFKITEAGKKIEFYDVLVDPWKYGGGQEDEWRNW